MTDTTFDATRDARDLATERKKLLQDALILAAAGPPYIAGEQWAVSAVRFLRAEIRQTSRQAHLDDCASRDGRGCDCF